MSLWPGKQPAWKRLLMVACGRHRPVDHLQADGDTSGAPWPPQKPQRQGPKATGHTQLASEWYPHRMWNQSANGTEGQGVLLALQHVASLASI